MGAATEPGAATRRGPLTRWLEGASAPAFSLYAGVMGFATYFCMYAFRKPFAAASYEDVDFLGGDLTAKTAFVLSQLVGYTLSKFAGIRICSEIGPDRRLHWNLGLIGASLAALVLFAWLPGPWKLLAIFANGLPLGMVWGLCVSYLEGRRTSDFILVALSCSFIVSSGVVKDVGRWLMSSYGVGEFAMPALTGLLFLPAFVVFAWLLHQLPQPSREEAELRTKRVPMRREDRLAFLRTFLPGLVLLIVVYLFLTAFRDYRDNYGIDLFRELGEAGTAAVFTRSEVPVGIGVMVCVAALTLVRSNRNGLIGAFLLMIAGMLTLAGSTWLFRAGSIDAIAWMVATGFGSYLAYVPYNSVLFDRMIGYTRATSTAVFTIYLADATGYSGSVLIQLYQDLYRTQTTRLEFFLEFAVVLGLGGAVLLAAGLVYFLWRGPVGTEAGAASGARSTGI